MTHHQPGLPPREELHGPSQQAGGSSAKRQRTDSSQGNTEAGNAFHSPDSTRPAVGKLHHHYNDPRGNVEVKSSDGMRFKVHGHMLSKSRTFFRDLLSVPQATTSEGGNASREAPIEVDLDAYSTKVIEIYLDCTLASQIPAPPQTITHDDLENLCLLAIYLGCDSFMEPLRKEALGRLGASRLLHLAGCDGDNASFIHRAFDILRSDFRTLKTRVDDAEAATFARIPHRYLASMFRRTLQTYSHAWFNTSAEVDAFICEMKGR